MLVIILHIVLVLLGIIVVLLLAAVIHTAAMKRPVYAGNSTPEPKNPQRYAKSLSEMIKCETVSDSGSPDTAKFYNFQKLLSELYPKIANTLEKKDFDGSVLYRWKGAGDKGPLVLMAHMDVVEPGINWSREPFSGEISDGRVWGRGAVDTKCSLCAIMEAVEELLCENYIPQRDIYIAFSRNEEISGPGAPSMVQYFSENKIEPECVLDEGGIIMDSPVAGIIGRYAVVGIMEKGYGDVKFTARGKGGHSSTPPRNTPVARLAGLITRLETRSPFRQKLSKPLRDMFGSMAPYMNFKMRLVIGNLWLFGGILKKVLPIISSEGAAMLKTSCVFTVMRGSKSNNVIPQEASAIANLRFMPFQNMEESLTLLKKIAVKYDVETELIHGNPATPITDVNGKIFKSLIKITQTCFPEAGVGPYVMLGGTDSQNYSGICDNILRFAPFYVDSQQYQSIHSADENIYIDSLAKGVVFYRYLIENLE